MGISILSSLPTASHHSLFPQQLLYNKTSATTPLRYPSKSAISLSSSSSPSASINIVLKDGSAPSLPQNDAETTNQEFENLPTGGGCKACGREEIENGCNGEGRIQGGIATVAGFGWWPIKAYRPCPAFVASGGMYRRRGQSMDEVAFGSGEPTSNTARTSSKDSAG